MPKEKTPQGKRDKKKGEGMSEYERKRMENIRQNEAKLATLEVPKGIVRESLRLAPHRVSFKKHTNKKNTRKSRPPPLPLRASERLRNKNTDTLIDPMRMEEMKREMAQREHTKPTRPRPPLTAKMPFDPQDGATETFLRVMKEAACTVKPQTHTRSLSLPLASLTSSLSVKNAGGVAKIVPDRIYSMASTQVVTRFSWPQEAKRVTSAFGTPPHSSMTPLPIPL